MEPEGATSQSNKVHIQCHAITSVEYLEGSFLITAGQPAPISPPTVTQAGATWTIEVNCGREQSSPVALKFVGSCGGEGHMYMAKADDDVIPGQLNFMFGLRVGFDIDGDTTFADIYLAQGRTGGANVWWIGADQLAYDAASQVAALCFPDIPTGWPREVLGVSSSGNTISFLSWLHSGAVPENPNWLSSLPDTQSIATINLPGTHDSAAITRWRYSAYACHYNSISKQLLSGVRLLDIRLSVHQKNGEFSFKTAHGTWGSNEFQSFTSLMDECSVFLENNGGEFIAMSLKVDDWNGLKHQEEAANKALAKILAAYPVRKAGWMPKLVDVRGKIYLMNRINTTLQLGVPMHWIDNTKGETLNANSDGRLFSIYVQDHYEGYGLHAEQQKLELFINAIEKSKGKTLLFNFASGVKGLGWGIYITDRFLNYLGSKSLADRPTKLGWMLFDYISTSYPSQVYGNLNVIQLVIASNFNYKNFEKKFKVG